MEEQKELIEGATVKMGGRVFVVPALNFKRLKKLRGELQLLGAVDSSTEMSDIQIEASITIVHTALTRNYPTLTRDDVEELIDLRNLQEIMSAITGQSGLVKNEGE